eukprot:2112061-Pyramimonas_sp.AAC.1
MPPKRVDKNRWQTEHCSNRCSCRYSGGTGGSPGNRPAACSFRCGRMLWWSPQPAEDAASPRGHPGTG